MSDMTPDPSGTPTQWPRHDRRGSNWIAGVVLIVLGVAFLAERAGYFVLTENWWALFIYLAAVACFANVWRAYRAAGRFGPSATGSLIWGLVLTVVATILFFNLSWDTWWPAILIVIGAGIVAGNLFGSRR
jgi:Na+/pantothenate symporter